MKNHPQVDLDRVLDLVYVIYVQNCALVCFYLFEFSTCCQYGFSCESGD